MANLLQARKRKNSQGIRGREGIAGWLFITPMLVLLGLFLVVPVIMAAWVAVSDWTGRGSPFSSNVGFVGFDNFSKLLVEPGLAQNDFGVSIRNNAYYVLLVVPLQTAVALFLAVMVNRKLLKARGAFRTAFYFPSVTSSVAITVVFLFLFSTTGAVNSVLSAFGTEGPKWFSDPRGILHIFLENIGVEKFEEGSFLGVSAWNWLSGPSPAMTVFIIMAIFTTSGTFMLLFLSALQNIQDDVEEAAIMDGANGWQRFWRVTLPMLKPTLFTVLTLGLIGTWQTFDQIYVGTQGMPAKTTLTPAYLAYTASFQSGQWGRGAAIAFLLFGIIVMMTILQRIILRDRKTIPKRKRFYRDGPPSDPSPTPIPKRVTAAASPSPKDPS